ncbi:MAG: hypothetical protein AAGI91_14860 [Bacteroidota bacterium]
MSRPLLARLRRLATPLLAAGAFLAADASAQPFEEATHDVGNIGLTISNAGFYGNSDVRNSGGAAPPSMEYPLESGIEHLFEAGLWVGALRADGLVTVRSAAITSGGGYQPGATGYEMAQASLIQGRSSIPSDPSFSPLSVSQQDFVSTFVDTASVVPGTFTATPDPGGRLGISVESRSYAWSFPFTEYFVIVEHEITNVSDAPWDSVWVGMWDDLVTRNIITTTDQGGEFFNKGGRGFLGYPEYAPDGSVSDAATDSQFVSYNWNVGGTEESLNTYGAVAFLGAEWDDPASGTRRFFHPFVQDAYRADGLPVPRANPRWWKFTGATDILNRPQNDLERYERMVTPTPIDEPLPGDQTPLRERLATDGLTSEGNWISVFSVGPFSEVAPGSSVTVTWAFVAALKPEEFQGQAGRAIDNEDSRALLRNNVFWAQRTYAGEDFDYDGELDAGEDINGNGVLDRYLIPEPPASPALRVETRPGQAILYWDTSSEESVDPITGRQDFEGYRIYRTDPGDDRAGDLFGQADLLVQYDRRGNDIGFNTGFDAVRLDAPATFPGDERTYEYRYVAEGLLSGWQYGFAVTAFDEGDREAGLDSFESSRTANAVRVFPGAAAATGGDRPEPVVYPNPYRVQAAWDGQSNNARKLYFSGLPARAEIRVYTVAGEIVAEMQHDAADPSGGDIGWYGALSGENRVTAGGEHAWDILSENGLQIAGGLYLFSVRDLDTGETQTGKFVVIR